MAIQLISSDGTIITDQLSSCVWDITVPINTDNNLVYGGVVTWLQDYDFYVSPAGYYINGVFYESPEAFITLNPADPSLDRFDVIYVDADQIVKVLEGDPSLTPSQPGLDLGLQLGLGVIFVEAGSSSPVDLTLECLTAWTPTPSDGDIDVASPSANCVDASGIEATSADNGDFVVWDRGSTFNPSTDFNVMTFRLKPKGDWSNDPNLNHRIKFQFYLAGIPVGSAVFLGDTAFNFSNTLLACQIISIPIIQFGLGPSALADQLRLTVISEYNPPTYPFGFYLDGLCLQGGIFGATESDDIHNQYFGPQTPGRYWISGNANVQGWITSPQMVAGVPQSGSEKFGWASSTTGTTATALGYLAQANGQEGATAVGNQARADVGVAVGFYSQSVRSVAVGGSSIASGGTAVGFGAYNDALSGTALGGGASTTNYFSSGAVAVGYYARVASAYGGIAIGPGAYVQPGHSFSGAIGIEATTTAPYQFVIGGDTLYTDTGYQSLYFGSGVTSPFSANRFWSVTGAEGTDIAGSSWTLAGAPATGNAASGPIYLQTSDPTASGSTLQSWSTKVGLNSNTLGFYMANTRLQMTEGSNVVAAGDLTLGTGNAFTVTGNTGINAITSTNWQDGAVIYLLFTGVPTVQHNVVGGAGTSPIKLAGSVDFTVSNDTVLELQLKDGFWREVGRTQTSAIGPYTFLNGIHEEGGGLVKLGGTLIEDTLVNGVDTHTMAFGAVESFVVSANDSVLISTTDVGATGIQIIGFQNAPIYLNSNGAAGVITLESEDIFFDSANEITMSADTRVRVSTSRFELSEGNDVIAANDLTLPYDGNAFLITGNTQINAITNTDWQEGSTITLHISGTPTLKNNTVGGAGTTPMRLAGAVDFVIAGFTVIELQLKDGFWNEVGRTISTGGGAGLVSVDNALTLSTATNAQWGGTLLHDTNVELNDFISTFTNNTTFRKFSLDPVADIYQIGDIDDEGVGLKVIIASAIDTFLISDALENFFQIEAVSRVSNWGFTEQAIQIDAPNALTIIGDINVSGNGTTLQINDTDQFVRLLSSRFQQFYGTDTVAANDLVLPPEGNAIEITGNTQINAISHLLWQDGSLVQLHLTGTPTIKHNTAGGANTSPIRLAGAVDFTITGYTVLELQLKDGFWNEVGRTQAGVPAGISADNGLTENVPNNVQLGGTLLQNTTIAGGASFNLSLTGSTSNNLFQSTNSATGNAIYGQSVDGFGVGGVSTNYHAISGISTNSRGGSFESTGDLGVYAQTSSGASAIVGFQNSATTNTVINVIRATRFSTGVAGDGIGGSLEFQTKTTVNNKVSNQLISQWTTAADATRTSQFIVTGVNSAVTADLLTVSGSGSTRNNKYGIGTFTGTPATYAAWDSSGNLIELSSISQGPVITADNGLTKNTATNVQWGGIVSSPSPLLHDTYIDTTVNYYVDITGAKTGGSGILRVTQTGASESAIVGVASNGAVAKAIHGITSSGVAVWGAATGGLAGGLFANTTGIGLNAQTSGASSGVVLELINSSTATASTHEMIRMRKSSTGTPAAGFGNHIRFDASSDTTPDRNQAVIASYWTTATDASRTSQLDFQAGNNGAALGTIMSVHGSGVVGIGRSTAYVATRLDIQDNTVTTNDIVEVNSTSLSSGSAVKVTVASTGLINAGKGLEVQLSGTTAAGGATYAGYFRNTKSDGTGNNYGVYGEASGGGNDFGVYGVSASFTGVTGATTSGTALSGIAGGSGNGAVVSSISGKGFQASSVSGLPAEIINFNTGTSNVATILQLSRYTTGTSLAGIGGGLDFYIEPDSGSATLLSNQIQSQWTVPVTATRTSQLDIKGVNSASTATLMSAHGSGVVGIGISSAYTATRFNVVDNTIAAIPMVNLTSTSTAASSNVQKVLNIDLSGANANSTQTTYGSYISNTHTGTSSTNYGGRFVADGASSENIAVEGRSSTAGGVGVRGFNLASNGIGVFGYGASTGIGGSFSSDDGLAMTAESSTNIAVSGTTTSGTAVAILHNANTGTNNVVANTIMRRSTSGTAAAGIGQTIDIEIEANDNNIYLANQIESKYNSAAVASRDSTLTVRGIFGSSIVDVATFHGDGSWNIRPISAAAASAITPSEGKFVFVSTTDATFVTVGIWCYQNGAWKAL